MVFKGPGKEKKARKGNALSTSPNSKKLGRV